MDLEELYSVSYVNDKDKMYIGWLGLGENSLTPPLICCIYCLRDIIYGWTVY